MGVFDCVDPHAQAACIALPTSVDFGSLDVLGFQQDRDQRFLSGSE
jgi:hypothetical protein